MKQAEEHRIAMTDEKHHGEHHSPSVAGCVSQVPIFRHLEQDQLLEILSVTRTQKYKRGETIYRTGEPSDGLYIVNGGRIKIYRLAESGKEQLLRFLEPGDFGGELALFQETLHENYGEATVNTSICRVNRQDLRVILLRYPSISLKILAEFAQRLEQAEKQATRAAIERVETRLALYLAELLGSLNLRGEVVLPMSKKDLASYLGTTPESISRKLAELEEAGLIRQVDNRIIEILDGKGLQEV